MSGEAVPLSVVPTALHGASAVIGGQAAPLATPSATAPTSMEAAGQAGAAVTQALQAYRAAFAQRLSTVASGLDGAAGAYTAQEGANDQALSALAPTQWV
jgi:hypothetical protein